MNHTPSQLGRPSNANLGCCRYVDNVSWMANYLVGVVPFLVYATWDDADATHTTVSNHGREASAYLQFIVDYYDCLPEVSALEALAQAADWKCILTCASECFWNRQWWL